MKSKISDFHMMIQQYTLKSMLKRVLYYVYDLYDWSNKEALGALHKCGKARNFLVTGVYPVKITWEKGARYPQVGERIDAAVVVDYDKTKFEGIDDNGALANAYKEGWDFYRLCEGLGE